MGTPVTSVLLSSAEEAVCGREGLKQGIISADVSFLQILRQGRPGEVKGLRLDCLCFGAWNKLLPVFQSLRHC